MYEKLAKTILFQADPTISKKIISEEQCNYGPYFAEFNQSNLPLRTIYFASVKSPFDGLKLFLTLINLITSTIEVYTK